MKVIDSRPDPVFVKAGPAIRTVELRIGESQQGAERGATRHATLSPQEARLVAYALLFEAEEVEASATE